MGANAAALLTRAKRQRILENMVLRAPRDKKRRERRDGADKR